MSDKSVAERLQVKGDRRLAVVGASAALEKAIGANRARGGRGRGPSFCAESSNARQGSAEVAQGHIAHRHLLPSLPSKIAADLSRVANPTAGAPQHGFDTLSQIAIDDDRSALRLKRVK